MQCLTWLDRGRLPTVEVRAEVQRAFNDDLQRRFERTVWRDKPGSTWQLPCTSWYVDARGRNAALWPGMSVGYWMAMRTAAIADYVPAPAAAVASGVTASRRVA
jgi:hypothetical protein